MNIFERCKNTKSQGIIGLGRAIEYFTSIGWIVSLPLNDSQDYDLIVDDGNKLLKVQVKTTNCKKNKDGTIFALNLAVMGGNSKENFVHKTNTQIEYDYLFAVSGDGKEYLIPKSELMNVEKSISLGSKLKKSFEITRWGMTSGDVKAL